MAAAPHSAGLGKSDLSSSAMQPGPGDLAQVRLDNALALFEEFVRQTARHADAATLRGLERRFAERVQIQPSYWSQIKGRSRQIGERLARQFEQLCNKPAGWLDQPHTAAGGATTQRAAAPRAQDTRSSVPEPPGSESAPQDDDERFIVGLVLTYYRRHPQRARQRLLDLLGEVLTPPAAAAPPRPAAGAPRGEAAARAPAAPLSAAAEDAHALWLRSQTGVAPLKKKTK
jgi:hypothetical protein